MYTSAYFFKLNFSFYDSFLFKILYIKFLRQMVAKFNTGGHDKANGFETLRMHL
jgi:hypothetical protein